MSSRYFFRRRKRRQLVGDEILEIASPEGPRPPSPLQWSSPGVVPVLPVIVPLDASSSTATSVAYSLPWASSPALSPVDPRPSASAAPPSAAPLSQEVLSPCALLGPPASPRSLARAPPVTFVSEGTVSSRLSFSDQPLPSLAGLVPSSELRAPSSELRAPSSELRCSEHVVFTPREALRTPVSDFVSPGVIPAVPRPSLSGFVRRGIRWVSLASCLVFSVLWRTF
jgi:hypothetical protein